MKNHFITIVLFLSALNTFGNDYLWVSGSFDRGEFKFGYFLQLTINKGIFPFLYTYVHIFFHLMHTQL